MSPPPIVAVLQWWVSPLLSNMNHSKAKCNRLSSSAMKIRLKGEDSERCERLLAIYDHVGEIAKKIASMDDPLPGQLQKSIPRYIEGIATNSDRLTHSRCPVIIAGESLCDKSYVINALLGEDMLPCQDSTETAVICDISYDKENWCQVRCKHKYAVKFHNAVTFYAPAMELDWGVRE